MPRPLVAALACALAGTAAAAGAAAPDPQRARAACRDGDCVLVDPALSAFSSDLPVLVVDTGGARPGRAPVPSAIALFTPAADGRARLSAPPDLVARADVRLRGASSLRHPKKPLLLRLAGAGGDDAPRALLGMPAAARWVLRASYTDKTLLRDALASALARDLGLPAPRARHVEVFLAEAGRAVREDDYAGVYVLMENVEVGPGRVEVERLRPEDVEEPAVTGGYLLRRDRPAPGDTVVRTRRGEALVVQEPPPGQVRPEQLAWIAAYVERLDSLLASPGAGDRAAARAFVDLGSFVDHALLAEVTKNADALKSSTFFAKPRGAPLRAGPPWDHDVAMRNDRIAVDPTGWQVLRAREGRSPWWPRLAEDPDVAQAFADRYRALRAGPLSTQAVQGRLRALAGSVREAARRNFARWPVLGRRLGPNPDAPRTWEEEVANLEAWLATRLLWLDAQWPVPPRLARDAAGPVALTDGGELVAAPEDPRAPGGAATPAAATLPGSAAEHTVLLETASAPWRCGAPRAIRIEVPAGVDELRIETTAPAVDGFRLSLAGAELAARPPLPIVRPLPELGSAVGRGGLRLVFRSPAPPPGAHALAVEPARHPDAAGPCRLPALRVVAVRLARHPLHEGARVLRVREARRWSAPVVR